MRKCGDHNSQVTKICGIWTSPYGGSPPSTSPPPTSAPAFKAPAIPPSQPVCNPNPIGHYHDSHEGTIREATRTYCSLFAKKIVHAKSENNEEDFKPGWKPLMNVSGHEGRDDIYDFRLKSVAGCPAPQGYNLNEPIRGVKCEDLLFNAWKKCEFSLVIQRVGCF